MGKSNLKKRLVAPYVEFKIVNEDRSGFLKEVTSTFGEMKINITYLQSQTDKRMTFGAVILRCDLLPGDKIQKLLIKLKKLKGTKEVSYKTNR